MCDVILYGDSTGLTLLFAELAGQASGLADLFDSSTAVMAGTAHCIGGGFRNELNEVTRTGGDTFTAGLAFAAVYTGNSLIYGDSAKRTGRGAGTKTDTAITMLPFSQAKMPVSFL